MTRAGGVLKIVPGRLRIGVVVRVAVRVKKKVYQSPILRVILRLNELANRKRTS